jgi:hypothetical protein
VIGAAASVRGHSDSEHDSRIPIVLSVHSSLASSLAPCLALGNLTPKYTAGRRVPLKMRAKAPQIRTFIAHDRLSHIKQKPASLRAGWWGACGEPGGKEAELRPTKKGVAAATKKNYQERPASAWKAWWSALTSKSSKSGHLSIIVPF